MDGNSTDWDFKSIIWKGRCMEWNINLLVNLSNPLGTFFACCLKRSKGKVWMIPLWNWIPRSGREQRNLSGVLFTSILLEGRTEEMLVLQSLLMNPIRFGIVRGLGSNMLETHTSNCKVGTLELERLKSK